MNLFFYHNSLHPNRFVFRGPEIPTDPGSRDRGAGQYRRMGAYAYLSELDKEKSKTEADEEREEAEQETAPKTEENEGDTEQKLKRAKQETPRKLFENPAEKKRLREEIEGLTNEQLREYYDSHLPQNYNRNWQKWNMDFAKGTLNKEDANHLTARKYAWVFQEWLRGPRHLKDRVDGCIGKKTVEALGGYLGIESGQSSSEESRERSERIPELSEENEGIYLNAYKIALKKGYPNLDIDRGFVIDRSTFTAIFSDIVANEFSFNPFDIRAWEGRFRDVLPLISKDELLKIYPYYPIGSMEEETPERTASRANPATEDIEQSNAPRQISQYMLNNITAYINNIKNLVDHNQQIDNIEKNKHADINKLNNEAQFLRIGSLYSDRNNDVRTSHGSFVETYNNWKTLNTFYENRINGSEVENQPIGLQKKQELETAKDTKDTKKQELQAEINKYYSDLTRLYNKRWEDYRTKLVFEIRKYDLPVNNRVDIDKISSTSYKTHRTTADEIMTPVTRYHDNVEKHKNFLVGHLEKYLSEVPTQIIQQSDQMNRYIKFKGRSKEGNIIEVANLLKGRDYVKEVNNFIYFHNYMRLQKKLSEIAQNINREVRAEEIRLNNFTA